MYRCDGSKWLEWRWEAGNQYLNILRDSQLPQSRKDDDGEKKGAKNYKPRIASQERMTKARNRPPQKVKPKPSRFGDVHCKRGFGFNELRSFFYKLRNRQFISIKQLVLLLLLLLLIS